MFEPYERRARLAPAALLAVPALALILAGGLAPTKDGSIIAVLAGLLGMIVSAVVRDRGKALEAAMWESWGGAPTTARLRWNGNGSDVVAERHRLVQVVTGEPLPSAAEEAADSTAADQRYIRAVATLRTLTQKGEDFPLVKAEVTAYGFRRNTLGLKPWAQVVAFAALAVSVVLWLSGHDVRFLVAAVVAAVCLAAWWVAVTPDWVRPAAERYADRLIDGLEILRRDRRAPSGTS